MMHSVNIMVEDSPNTTSSVEYKHQYYHQNGTGQLSLNGAKRQLVAIEVGS